MIKVLYIEDDANLAFLVIDQLEQKGSYEIDHFSDGNAIITIAKSKAYDILLLDINLQNGKNGFELFELMQDNFIKIPTLFLTARGLKDDRVLGLRLGAADYLVKPFSIEELHLRIANILNRNNQAIAKWVQIGEYVLDIENQELKHHTTSTRLTLKETQLLTMLALQLNTIIKREAILMKIWGDDDYFLGRSLDVFITKLRKYLSSDPKIKLRNIHGVGFLLEVNG
jgi:DNA-binding response OmpR family regulator